MNFTNKDTFIVSVAGCLNSDFDSMESVMVGNEAGANGCEIDLDMTSDGIAVLCNNGGFIGHDGNSISLEDATYDEVRNFFKKVVTVGQAIELAKSCAAKLCIDLKNIKAAFPARLSLKHADYLDSTIFVGLSFSEAVALLKSQPTLNLMADVNKTIEDSGVEDLVGKAKDAGLFGLHVRPDCLTRALCEEAHRVGLYISTAECNDDAQLKTLIDWNVNFILTARPDLASAHLPVVEVLETPFQF